MFKPFTMCPNSQKLERLLDAVTEDIFNDIECAKAVINEAGFDSTISYTEGVRKLVQLQEDTTRQSNSIAVCDVGRYSVNLNISVEHTVFRIDETHLEKGGKLFVKLLFLATDKVPGKSNCVSLSKHIDEEKLQLN